MHAARMLNEILFGIIREQRRGETYWRNNIGCSTTYQTRNFFNNSKTNEDNATKQTHTTDTFLFISHTMNVLLFKSRCNIFIAFRIIKEMSGLVGSRTSCIKTNVEGQNKKFLVLKRNKQWDIFNVVRNLGFHQSQGNVLVRYLFVSKEQWFHQLKFSTNNVMGEKYIEYCMENTRGKKADDQK